MLVFEVFLLSMMVVLLLNDDNDPNAGYPAKSGNYSIVLKLTHRSVPCNLQFKYITEREHNAVAQKKSAKKLV